MIVGVDGLRKNLSKYGLNFKTNVANAYQETIVEGENYAKNNAKWIDRTGNARNSITASGPEESGGSLKWYLAILVFYGVYLELKNEGKYRIIGPTLNVMITNLIRNLQLAAAKTTV